MKKYKLSVIVPVYNTAPYLRECLDSIVSQTYENLEIICVDDGSTDNSGDICDEYAEKYSSITVLHKKNEGLYAARRDGVLASTGDFIGFVDSDDYIDVNMYESLMYYVDRFEVDVVVSGVIDKEKRIERIRKPYFSEGLYKEARFCSDILPKAIYTGEFYQYGITVYLCNKVFRRNFILEYQTQEKNVGLEILNDAMVTWPIIFKTKNVYITHDCYYHYRIRFNSKKRKRIVDQKSIIDKFSRKWFITLTEYLTDEQAKQIAYQFSWYVVYLLAAKQPEFFDTVFDSTHLRLYGGIAENKSVIVYGAGMVGINLMHFLDSLKNTTVVAWLDRSWESIDKKYGIEAPEIVKAIDYDYILVAIARSIHVSSAMQYLKNLGVDMNRVRTMDNNVLLTWHNKYYEGFLK